MLILQLKNLILNGAVLRVSKPFNTIRKIGSNQVQTQSREFQLRALMSLCVQTAKCYSQETLTIETENAQLETHLQELRKPSPLIESKTPILSWLIPSKRKN